MSGNQYKMVAQRGFQQFLCGRRWNSHPDLGPAQIRCMAAFEQGALRPPPTVQIRPPQPNVVANLMLIRNLALHFFAQNAGRYKSLPAFVEDVVAPPRLAFSLIQASS